jgi:hypothetical protein
MKNNEHFFKNFNEDFENNWEINSPNKNLDWPWGFRQYYHKLIQACITRMVINSLFNGVQLGFN